MRRFLRDEPVRGRLQVNPHGLFLLTGDHGTGKSQLLVSVQLDCRDWAFAPPPAQVAHSPAALQMALLEALSGAAALIAQEAGRAAALKAVLGGAARAVGRDRLAGLRSAARNMLLDQVRLRLGDTAADLLADFSDAVVEGSGSGLRARLSTVGDRDVIDVVLELAAEVSEVAAGRPVLLALDSAERLGEGDISRLADVAERLPSGLGVRVAHATADVAARDRVDRLRSAGALREELGGLDEGEVRLWLTDAGQDAGLSAQVLAATNGYPLHVADAVSLLDSGQSVEKLQPDGVLQAATEAAWRHLGEFEQRAAILLSSLSDPMEPAAAAEHLGISELDWTVLEGKLLAARMFVPSPNGPWFHTLRRKHLRAEVLTSQQRRLADAAAVETFDRLFVGLAVPGGRSRPVPQPGRLALVTGDGGGLWAKGLPRLPGPKAVAALVARAELLIANPSLSDDVGVVYLTTADLADVAMAAALIELRSAGERALPLGSVLEHARQAFAGGVSGALPVEQLAIALERLQDAGMVDLTAGDEPSTVLPLNWSREVTLTVAGRAGLELGRVPVPSLAEVLFDEVLRPRAAEHERLVVGFGAPPVGEMARLARQLDLGSGPRASPTLLVRATHGTVPIWAAGVYGNIDSRDGAADALRGLSEGVWGVPLLVEDVFAGPLPAVRSRRFLRALRRAMRRGRWPSGSTVAPKATRSMTLAEHTTARAQAVARMRELATPQERAAFALERSTGFLFSGDETTALIAEVVGGTGARQVLVSNVFGRRDERLALALSGDLSAGERVGRITRRYGAPVERDPIIEEAMRLTAAAERFNSTAEPLVLPLTREALEPALADANEQAGIDALALAPLVDPSMPAAELGRQQELVLLLDAPEPDYVPGAHAVLYSRSTRCHPDDAWLTLRVDALTEPHSESPLDLGRIAELFGVGADALFESDFGDGMATWVLPDELGYRERDVRFVYS